MFGLITQTGIPLSELHVYEKPAFDSSSLVRTVVPAEFHSRPATKASMELHMPGSITLVRNRMFYARAALNAKGEVRFGLRHIRKPVCAPIKSFVFLRMLDVLNRYGDCDNPAHTAHLMKYIFPRQFGLHNVFTSTVDTRETVQPFKDYTLREQEIALAERQKRSKGRLSAVSMTKSKERLPKRLRGILVDLARKLQKLHARCPYTELLKHYCPVDVSPPIG